MKPEFVSYVCAAGAAATATFMVAKIFHTNQLVTLQRQFTQSEDNVAQLVEEYGVQLQCKASMASELVELRDELAAAEEREAVLQQQLTESEEQRRGVQQQLDTVKNRVESLQGQLRVLQGALEEVAHSGSLQGLVLPLMDVGDCVGADMNNPSAGSNTQHAADGTTSTRNDDNDVDQQDARMQALAAATAAVLPGEVQRLRGQVVQLEAQCRLRDVEAGQLRASLSDLQRRHETALLDHAAAVTAATSLPNTPPSSTSELHMLKQEIQRLKQQLNIRRHGGASSTRSSSSHPPPQHRITRCDSDASDAASVVSTSSSRRVHRTPGLSSSSAFGSGALHGGAGSAGPGSTDDNDDTPTGMHSSSNASVGEPCCSGGDMTTCEPLTPMPSEEPTILGVGQGQRHDHGGHPSHHDANTHDAGGNYTTTAYTGRRHSFSAAHSVPHATTTTTQHTTNNNPRPPRPLSRSASGGVDMPERSISVRTSLQTWEALAALSSQGNKGLVVPSPRKLYWAGYKGVMLDDDH